jgi:hypothetical protein
MKCWSQGDSQSGNGSQLSTVNCQIFHLSLPTVIDWRGTRKLSRKHWLCSTRWVTHAAISEMKFTPGLQGSQDLFYSFHHPKNYVKYAFSFIFPPSARYNCMGCGVAHWLVHLPAVKYLGHRFAGLGLADSRFRGTSMYADLMTAALDTAANHKELHEFIYFMYRRPILFDWSLPVFGLA